MKQIINCFCTMLLGSGTILAVEKGIAQGKEATISGDESERLWPGFGVQGCGRGLLGRA